MAKIKNPIVSGGADVSSVTATASDVLSPKVIVGADGEPITGVLEKKTLSITPDIHNQTTYTAPVNTLYNQVTVNPVSVFTAPRNNVWNYREISRTQLLFRTNNASIDSQAQLAEYLGEKSVLIMMPGRGMLKISSDSSVTNLAWLIALVQKADDNLWNVSAVESQTVNRSSFVVGFPPVKFATIQIVFAKDYDTAEYSDTYSYLYQITNPGAADSGFLINQDYEAYDIFIYNI